MFLNTTNDWLEPIPPLEPERPRRHTDVSQDPRYKTKTSTKDDEECITAPDRFPEWILPKEAQDALYKAGHSTAPDLIYAKGIPNTLSPDRGAFDRKSATSSLSRSDSAGTSDATLS